MRAEIDEDIPRSRGGNADTDRSNCHLAHRKCNKAKGNMTLEEYFNVQQGTIVKTTTLVNW